MAEDPICGMAVDPRTAQWKSLFSNKVFYFCSQECKEQFDSDPVLYSNESLLGIGD